MRGAAIRWARRLLVLGACAGVLAVAVHTPWVRGWVLHVLTARLSAGSQFVYSASSLDYSLLRLTVTVDGLQVSRRGAAEPPLLRVRHAEAALSSRVLAGAIEVDRLEADGVALLIVAEPRQSAAAGPTAPFRVPQFTVGHAEVRHANVEFLDPAGLGHLSARDITLEADGGGPRRLAGSFVVPGGVTLDSEQARVKIGRIEGVAFLDGDTIGVKPASAVAGTQRLALDGTIAFTGPSPAFDLGIQGGIDVAEITRWFPALPAGNGELQLRGRVTGPIDDPQFTYSARSAGVTLPDIRVPASIAEGAITRRGVQIDRMRTGIDGGWVEASGRIPLGLGDPVSRFSLKWSDLPVSGLAKVFTHLPADPIGMVSSGSARVRWPGTALEFASVEGEAESEVRFAPALPPARVSLAAAPGRWTLRGEQGLEGRTEASLEAGITVSPADFTRSELDGTLRVSSEDVTAAILEIRRAFPAQPDVTAWISHSPLTIESAIDGTLGAPRLSGTAASDRLHVGGLPPLRVSAAIEATPSRLVVSKASGDDGAGNRIEGHLGIEFDTRTTAGGVRADITNPTPVLAVLTGEGSKADGGLKASGRAVLTGEWNGPVDDPVLSMTLTGRDISVSSPEFAVERASADGRLEGPLSGPAATVRMALGVLRVGSSVPVPAEAFLALKSGRLEMTAQVPDWSASLSGHMAAAAPHEFAGTLSIDSLTVASCTTLLGRQESGWTADGMVSARFDVTGAFDSRTLVAGGHASLTGGAFQVGDRRYVDGIDAALDVREGRLWLTRLTGSGAGGPLSASGDLPLNWAEEYLPNGWRIGGVSPAPKPASFELRAEPDVKTVGRWLRPDEPGRITGSLRMQASGTASAPSLQAVDGLVVIGPGTVTVRDAAFTLTRAAEVLIKNGHARVEGVTVTAPGTTSSLSGTVELAGSRAIDAHVAASGVLGFLSSIAPGRVAGNFNADVRATGTVTDPKIVGRLSLDGAAWVWPEQRLALRDWSGSATFSSGTLTIEKLAGHVNGGDADVAGAVTFGGTAGAGLTLRVRDAFAEVVKGLRSQADADLTVNSAGAGARISGTVTVTSGAYREPITAMARLFSSPRTPATAPEAESSALKAVELDIDLKASSPIIIENSAGRLDLVPSMKLGGSLAEPVLFGTLDMVDNGRLTLAGRTFRLSEARVVFSGAGDPAVQLIGETRVGDYDVTLRTQGPVTSLQATYTSDPPLSERDLQSLLVTGRTADVTSTKSSADEQFVLGTASSDLLGLAGQMVGLESVQLGRGDFELGSSDVNPATRLTVSKRLNARTSLVLSQDLDNNKLTWIVVFVPKRGYEIRLSQRDNTEEVIEFRQELGFGPGVSPPTTSGFRRRTKGPIVEALVFTGAPGYPDSELTSAVRLKPSKEFDAGTWQEDRARLEAFYRDRGYATARIVPARTVLTDDHAGRIRLEYRIDPGPRTLLTVSGIDLSKNERRDLMQAWSRSVLPEFVREDLTRQLREQLAARGHLRPSVAVAVETPTPETTLVKVTVTPGPMSSTRKLTIEGANAVTEPELRAALAGNPSLDASWVDPAPLVEAVSAAYADRGYPSTRVVADDLVFEGDVAERRLRVTEGPRAVVKDIVMTGVAETRSADARSAVALPEGQPLLPGTEADARRRLQRFYLDRGFRSAAVRSSGKVDADGRATLTFVVTEGPMSVVSAVAVKGLDATKPSVADNAITLKPGEPAGQQEVADTQKRLYGLGVFRSADVSFEPAPQVEATAAATTPVRMTVSLEEARRFQLRYGVQLSNQYGPVLEDFTSAIGVAGDIRDRNFLGRAFTLGASGRLEKNLQSLRGQFSLPPGFNQRLQTSLYATFRSETDTSEESVTYTDKERDLTFEQRLRLPAHMEVTWGYSFNLRDVALGVQTRNESIELKGALGTVNSTFIFDSRDKPFNASRGWFQSTNLQWGLQALGSDLDYVRVLLRQFYYKPAGPLIFASGLRIGVLHGISGTPPITILDRFFDAGGAQTVRGYAEDSLSAVDILGQPVGGTKLLLLNEEVRFPLFSRWFQGAVFVDAGNTFTRGDTMALDKLAVGAGFGIRIMTPFAPIRIDLGYPLDRRPEDRRYRVYFSIGQIF